MDLGLISEYIEAVFTESFEASYEPEMIPIYRMYDIQTDGVTDLLLDSSNNLGFMMGSTSGERNLYYGDIELYHSAETGNAGYFEIKNTGVPFKFREYKAEYKRMAEGVIHRINGVFFKTVQYRQLAQADVIKACFNFTGVKIKYT